MVLGGLGEQPLWGKRSVECGLSTSATPDRLGSGFGGAKVLETRFAVGTMTKGTGGSSAVRAGLRLGSAVLFLSCSISTVPFPFSPCVSAAETAAQCRRLPRGFSAGASWFPFRSPNGERLGFRPPPPPGLSSRSRLGTKKTQFWGCLCTDSQGAAR